MKTKLLIGCILFLLVPTTSASISEEYLSEFSNAGEACDITDYFYYYDSNYKFTLPVFYSCCKEEDCITIPFDIQNIKEYGELNLVELFNLYYVREMLSTGELSTDIYSIGESFDICDYFGFDVAKEQSINLAAEATNQVKNQLPTKTKRTINLITKTGKSLGKISKFNPGIFVASVTCTGLLKEQREAFEQVALCNGYLTNIGEGNTQYGITNYLENCNTEASKKLKVVLDSLLSQIKEPIDVIGNVVSGLINWAQDPLSGKDIDIKKTKYQVAKEAYSKISKQDPYLRNPSSPILSEKVLIRLKEKKELANAEYYNYYSKLKNLKDDYPNPLKVFFTNIFYKPNFNLSEAKFQINYIESSLVNTKFLIEKSKYNSAVEFLEGSDIKINKINEIISREKGTKRSTDLIAVFVAFILIVLIYKIIKPKREEFT